MTLNEAIFRPVTALKGVGAKTAEALQSLGIYSIYDLLFYFPYRYDELENLPLDQLEPFLTQLKALDDLVKSFAPLNIK